MSPYLILILNPDVNANLMWWDYNTTD